MDGLVDLHGGSHVGNDTPLVAHAERLPAVRRRVSARVHRAVAAREGDLQPGSTQHPGQPRRRPRHGRRAPRPRRTGSSDRRSPAGWRWRRSRGAAGRPRSRAAAGPARPPAPGGRPRPEPPRVPPSLRGCLAAYPAWPTPQWPAGHEPSSASTGTSTPLPAARAATAARTAGTATRRRLVCVAASATTTSACGTSASRATGSPSQSGRDVARPVIVHSAALSHRVAASPSRPAIASRAAAAPKPAITTQVGDGRSRGAGGQRHGRRGDEEEGGAGRRDGQASRARIASHVRSCLWRKPRASAVRTRGSAAASA